MASEPGVDLLRQRVRRALAALSAGVPPAAPEDAFATYWEDTVTSSTTTAAATMPALEALPLLPLAPTSPPGSPTGFRGGGGGMVGVMLTPPPPPPASPLSGLTLGCFVEDQWGYRGLVTEAVPGEGGFVSVFWGRGWPEETFMRRDADKTRTLFRLSVRAAMHLERSRRKGRKALNDALYRYNLRVWKNGGGVN